MKLNVFEYKHILKWFKEITIGLMRPRRRKQVLNGSQDQKLPVGTAQKKNRKNSLCLSEIVLSES